MKSNAQKSPRALAHAAVVVAVFALLLAATSFVFTPKNNTAEAGQIEASANGILGEPANSIDVVFIGDSETSNTVSPLQMWNEYGFTSYVCATNGQKLPYSYTLLKRALANQSPRVVVIEANTLYTYFSTSSAVLRLAQDGVPALEYHDRWKSLTAADFTSLPTATWTDPFKGYKVLNWSNAASEDAHSYMEATDATERVPTRNRIYLQLLIETIRAAGATPVIEATPSTVCWSTKRHNEVSELANALGVDFIDLNELTDEMGIDWSSDTRDGGEHMNYSGSVKVSSKLGQLLQETYDLPDHRSDDACASWNDAYQGLLATVKSTETQ